VGKTVEIGRFNRKEFHGLRSGDCKQYRSMGKRGLILECGDLSPLSQVGIIRDAPTCAGN
jgi:hypothetical protein